MNPKQIENGFTAVKQQKTGAPLRIPLLPELREALAAAPVIGKDTILVTAQGNPFSEKGLGNFVKEACIAAGFLIALLTA